MKTELLLFLLLTVGWSMSEPLGEAHKDAGTIVLPAMGMTFRRIYRSQYGTNTSAFFLLETEVTNEMYARFLSATGRKKNDDRIRAQWQAFVSVEEHSPPTPEAYVYNVDLLWRAGRPPNGKERHPVGLVTIDDAAAFCDWLCVKHPRLGRFRLPTVSEWMIAAYGATRRYPWGATWEDRFVCLSNAVQGGTPSTEPVTSRPEGRTPEGLFGMWGNVEEFVTDAACTYNRNFRGIGSRWMGGSFHTKKEKDWPFAPRNDYWGYWHGTGRCQGIGFRVLLDPTGGGTTKSALSKARKGEGALGQARNDAAGNGTTGEE